MGIIVNSLAIIIGTLIGVTFNKYIKEQYRVRAMQIMGIVSLYIGVSSLYSEIGSIKNLKLLATIIVGGALIGRVINLEKKMDNFNKKFEGKGAVQGIILGFVLFCVGALSIVGPIKSALMNDNSLLYLNAVLSGLTSIILALNYGYYIMTLSVILFTWQGSIYLVAGSISSIMTPDIISQLSFIGGLLILASGINILNIGKIKTLNLLPTLALPILVKFLSFTM